MFVQYYADIMITFIYFAEIPNKNYLYIIIKKGNHQRNCLIGFISEVTCIVVIFSVMSKEWRATTGGRGEE